MHEQLSLNTKTRRMHCKRKQIHNTKEGKLLFMWIDRPAQPMGLTSRYVTEWVKTIWEYREWEWWWHQGDTIASKTLFHKTWKHEGIHMYVHETNKDQNHSTLWSEITSIYIYIHYCKWVDNSAIVFDHRYQFIVALWISN